MSTLRITNQPAASRASTRSRQAALVPTRDDHAVDLSPYRTFSLADGSPATSPLTEFYIRAGVARRLAARGLECTDGHADLVAVTHVIAYEQRGLDTWNLDTWPPSRGAPPRNVRPAIRRTILVDLFEARTGRLVWCGMSTHLASGRRSDNLSRVEKSLQKVFETLPW